MHRVLLASVVSCIGLALLTAEGSAQRLTLRSSGGPANAELAERLGKYVPGVTPVPPMTREVFWGGARDFKRGATAWIDAGEPGDQPRRRLAVAAYVLDIVKEFEDRALWAPTQPAVGLLEWACATLRKSAPLPAETAWHTAALALLERSGPVEVVKDHLDHAEPRFPKDDRWPLARALVDELESEYGWRDDGTLNITGGLAARGRQHFEQAAARPSTRQHALIRWARFESNLGRQEVALAHLSSAGPPASPILKYWHGVIRARALERANRSDEAIDAYRAVVNEFPQAQAAALSLAAALVVSQRLAEASAIVSKSVSLTPGPAPPPDPWDFYRVPDVLRWSQSFDELKRAVAAQ